MVSKSNDSNLLFGILAMKMGWISRDQMIEAIHRCGGENSTSVDRMLVANRTIDEESRALLLGVAEKSLEQNGNDLEKSLASLISFEDSLIEELGSLNESLFEGKLSFVGSPSVNPTRSVDSRSHSHGGRSFPTSSRFIKIRPHAKGGLGQVSVALDRELNREVALKEILDEHADSQGSRDRFLLEAEITGGLEHPGIIPVYGMGTYADGQPYYAMRFIRGISLKDAARQWHSCHGDSCNFQSLEFRRFIRRLINVCNAMEYAHNRGVLHRDLKPSNIMLGKFGETMVVDWGLAKTVGMGNSTIGMDEPTLRPSSGSAAVDTMMGQAVGTPAFMSPEQAAGQLDKLRPASDVYSLAQHFIIS